MALCRVRLVLRVKPDLREFRVKQEKLDLKVSRVHKVRLVHRVQIFTLSVP
jgi:hypothetical protein